jgi:hypothetical protein
MLIQSVSLLIDKVCFYCRYLFDAICGHVLQPIVCLFFFLVREAILCYYQAVVSSVRNRNGWDYGFGRSIKVIWLKCFGLR